VDLVLHKHWTEVMLYMPNRIGGLALQSMLAGLPEQTGIKFKAPQNVQTAGVNRSQPVVQRQGDLIAVLHAATAQTVICCHSPGD